MPSIMEMCRADESRKRFAKVRGLPTATPWSGIIQFDQEERRKRKVRRYGLRKNATWDEIFVHEDKLRADADNRERILDAREYGLPETATRDMIEKAKDALPSTDYPVDPSGEVESDDSDIG